MPFSRGHSAAGSELASALCTPTCTILGVNRSASTAATSIRAASASPSRSRSHERSATQSIGLTLAGAAPWRARRREARYAPSARRSACASAASASRGTPARRAPRRLAEPCVRGSTRPTIHGSRRAQPGYSTGGLADGRLPTDSSRDLLDRRLIGAAFGQRRGRRRSAALLGGGAGDGGSACVGAACCAIAGSARTTAADAIRMSLVRIAPGRRHGHLDRMGRLLLWGRATGRTSAPITSTARTMSTIRSRHAAAFAERGSRCIAPCGDSIWANVSTAR